MLSTSSGFIKTAFVELLPLSNWSRKRGLEDRLAADFGSTMLMSRKGNAWGKAAMEMKVERIRYDTRAQARLDIVD